MAESAEKKSEVVRTQQEKLRVPTVKPKESEATREVSISCLKVKNNIN